MTENDIIEAIDRFENSNLKKIDFYATSDLEEVLFGIADEDKKNVELYINWYKENYDDCAEAYERILDGVKIKYAFFPTTDNRHMCYVSKPIDSFKDYGDIYRWTIGVVPRKKEKVEKKVSIGVYLPLEMKKELVKLSNKYSKEKGVYYSLSSFVNVILYEYIDSHKESSKK